MGQNSWFGTTDLANKLIFRIDRLSNPTRALIRDSDSAEPESTFKKKKNSDLWFFYYHKQKFKYFQYVQEVLIYFI